MADFPDRLPAQHYDFPRDFDEYVRHQLGISVGHQGYANNFLMAEAFMKILPQAIYAQQIGLFDNPFTKKKPEIRLDPIFVERINQIWKKGLHCIIIRDPESTEKIVERRIAYQHPIKPLTIRNTKIEHPWEVQGKCNYCQGDMLAVMEDNSFDIWETNCLLFCKNCKYQEELEVEILPSFYDLDPIRPVSFNTVWREIRVQVPIKFALENVDLMTLASEDGGYYYDLGNNMKEPMFKSYQEILDSIDTTAFVSKAYFESRIRILFDEWLYYYNRLLVLMHQMIKEMRMNAISIEDKSYVPRIES